MIALTSPEHPDIRRDLCDPIRQELGRLAIDAPIDVAKCFKSPNGECVVWLVEGVSPFVAGFIECGVSAVAPGVTVRFVMSEEVRT